MSKKSTFAKMIKLIAAMLTWVVKTTAAILPGVVKTFIGSISKRLRFSITFKTVITYSFLFSTIFLIMNGLILAFFGGFLAYETKDSLEKSGKVTRNFLNEGYSVPEAEILNYAKVQGIQITLYNRDKEVVFSTDESDNPPKEALEQTKGFYTTFNDIYVSISTQDHPEIRYILASKSLTKEKAYLLFLLVILIIFYLLAIIFIIVKGSRNLKRMLSPINDMIGTAKTISANHLHNRLNVVNSHDELKDLAETFNNMLDRLQESYEQQNRFVSDASHELRTPISVIQGYADLLQRWGKENKEVTEESLKAIQNEANNMKELVERLLFLARMDKETQKIEKEKFLLNDLINEVVKETKMIDGNHQISCHMTSDTMIEADPGLIKQALRIFIDNSIKYTPPGGYIKINAASSNSTVTITVEDNGIGIDKEDIPFVFNRFYKCDKSRTREKGGTGLGLSIAKWIVEKHGGRIEVDSTIDAGTKITVRLPL